MIQGHYIYYALYFHYYYISFHHRSSGFRSWGLGNPVLQNCILWLILLIFKVVAVSFSLANSFHASPHFHQPLKAAIPTPLYARSCRLSSYSVLLPLWRKAASGILIIGHVLQSVNEAQSELLPFPLGRTELVWCLQELQAHGSCMQTPVAEFTASEGSEVELSSRLLAQLNSTEG